MSFARRSLVVLIAILLLVSNLVPSVTAATFVSQADAVTSSKEAALKRALFEMREAIDHYYFDHKRYPQSLKMLENERYIANIPTDPFTQRSNSWRAIPATLTVHGRRQRAGIFDVKSGSKRTALDGTRYSDW
jgi:general secretion pathway protein G